VINMRSLFLVMSLVSGLTVGSTAIFGGANPYFTLPMHAIYPATFTETCDDPAQSGVDCINVLPTFTLPEGATGPAVLYLLCFRHTELAGVQTALEFAPWTIIFDNWNCQVNQLSLVTPGNPGGPTAGRLSTAFDCVRSPSIQVVGFMTMNLTGTGCIRQVNPSGSLVQALDCQLEIDQFDVTVPPHDTRAGSVCIGPGGRDACELWTAVEPATWGGIKAQYK
jgi:hypothetical protein